MLMTAKGTTIKVVEIKQQTVFYHSTRMMNPVGKVKRMSFKAFQEWIHSYAKYVRPDEKMVGGFKWTPRKYEYIPTREMDL